MRKYLFQLGYGTFLLIGILGFAFIVRADAIATAERKAVHQEYCSKLGYLTAVFKNGQRLCAHPENGQLYWIPPGVFHK